MSDEINLLGLLKLRIHHAVWRKQIFRGRATAGKDKGNSE